MAAAPSSQRPELECASRRKDWQALVKKYGYADETAAKWGLGTASDMFASDLTQGRLEMWTRSSLLTLAKDIGIGAGNQKSAVIIQKILLYVADVTKQALPAMPLIPVTVVRTLLSSVPPDTPRVYASTANAVTHSGNTVAQVVVPSGSPTSISADSPMSTIVSHETKRFCGIGGADAVFVELPPHQAELAIVADLSSLTTKFQLEFNEALSKLSACTSHSEVKSGFAGSAIKTLWNVVSTFQNAWFPKKLKKKPQAVGDTLTGGISHQSGTPGGTSGGDAVPPACSAVPAVSVGVATRRRARKKSRSNAVPVVTEGPASDIMHGTIVGVNHVKRFAFIRTSRDTTDFHVGQQQYHHGMAIGDVVSFCELKPCGRRRRCPEAYRVDLLARAWTWYHRPYDARRRS